MYIKKKKFKALKAELAIAETAANSWKAIAESTKHDMDEWRKKYELSQLTPEVKADTEAAFMRGALFAKTQVLQNIYLMGQSLNIEMPKEEPNANI